MDNFVREYENAFSPDECKSIRDYIDSLEDRGYLTEATKKKHVTNHNSCNLAIRYDVTAGTWIGNNYLPKIKPCVDHYLEEFSPLSTCRFLLYDVKVKKIPEGGGFHAWHFENGRVNYAPRLFVVQTYLNDDFEAGETEFLHQHLRVTPKEGSVLIFPAGFTHIHRGNPPIGGTKYLLTTWGMLQHEDDE